MGGVFNALVRNGVPESIAHVIATTHAANSEPYGIPAADYLEKLSLQIWDAVDELGGKRDRAAAGGA
jgi:hypothetical protein